MRALFADRVEHKRELLRSLRAGASPAALPAPEVDLAVEPPVVTATAAPATTGKPSFSPPVTPTARRRRRSWRGVIALAAGIAVALAGWLAIGAARDKEAAATTSETAAPAPPPAPSPTPDVVPTAAPAKVVIDITTTPPGARVSIGGEDRGPTPMKLELDRASQPVKVDLTLSGYETLTETVTPDVDQRLALSLRPAFKARSGPRPQPSSAASGGRYRKFN
jgi:hypothetical protein